MDGDAISSTATNEIGSPASHRQEKDITGPPAPQIGTGSAGSGNEATKDDSSSSGSSDESSDGASSTNRTRKSNKSKVDDEAPDYSSSTSDSSSSHVSTSTKLWKLLDFPKFSTDITMCNLSANTINNI
jgi:hypothetical protein